MPWDAMGTVYHGPIVTPSHQIQPLEVWLFRWGKESDNIITHTHTLFTEQCANHADVSSLFGFRDLGLESAGEENIHTFQGQAE